MGAGYLQETGDVHEVVFKKESLDEHNAKDFSDTEILSTFINSSLDEAVLKHFPLLKFIAAKSPGCDHIGLRYCNDHGVKIANVPAYGTCPVAEHVFGLLLVISHTFNKAIDRTRGRDFSLKGFGMKVAAFDVNPDTDQASELGFSYFSLDELLGSSDIVTLHVPATEKTRHLISHKQFVKGNMHHQLTAHVPAGCCRQCILSKP